MPFGFLCFRMGAMNSGWVAPPPAWRYVRLSENRKSQAVFFAIEIDNAFIAFKVSYVASFIADQSIRSATTKSTFHLFYWI